MTQLRLGINIDHVATLRNARGGDHPCPIRAALAAEKAGADGITAHLREDRRHIRDADITRLKREVNLPLNLEMAATPEMQRIALEVLPHAVCLVPEKREELTTEGGLNVAAQVAMLTEYIAPLTQAGIRVSLFIDPAPAQIEAAKQIGAACVELHTGTYAHAFQQLSPPPLTEHLLTPSRLRNLDLFPPRLRGGAGAYAPSQAAQRSPIRWGWKSMPGMGWISTMSAPSPPSPPSANSISAIS